MASQLGGQRSRGKRMGMTSTVPVDTEQGHECTCYFPLLLSTAEITGMPIKGGGWMSLKC